MKTARPREALTDSGLADLTISRIRAISLSLSSGVVFTDPQLLAIHLSMADLLTGNCRTVAGVMSPAGMVLS